MTIRDSVVIRKELQGATNGTPHAKARFESMNNILVRFVRGLSASFYRLLCAPFGSAHLQTDLARPLGQSAFKAIKLLPLLGSLMLAASADVQAQSAYVRAGATGSNNGSDWANAYTTLPSTLQRGVTYYVADGSYSGYTFDDPASGTTPITIRKATLADHGTSTGWNDTYGDGTATFSGSFNFATDYYVVNGVTRNENDWTSQVYGFRVTGSITSWPLNYPPGGDHIAVSYCDVGGTVGSVYGGAGFNSNEACYFVNNSGTSFDFTVSRCFFHNNTLVQISGVDTVTIEYCYFKDMWAKECIRGQNKAKNGIIRHCIFQDTTRDTGKAGETGTAPIAIWDDPNSGNLDSWQIYGNVFFDTTTIAHSGGCILVGGGSGGWPGVPTNNTKIYNNTIVNFLGSYSADITINGGAGNEVRNNLWFNCIGTPVASPNTGSNGEVASNPFVASAAFNFHLSAALPGTGLTAPYNTDMDRTARGSDGVFDRGAFEFGGGPDTIPPSISGVAVGSITSNSATISFTTSEPAQSGTQYGITNSYGNNGPANATFQTSHSSTLSGLAANTVYHYSVNVTDAAGNRTDSADMTFQTTTTSPSDTTAPTVSVTAPTAGSTINGTVNLTATASDNVGVSGVTFILDGTAMGAEDVVSPYSLSWNTAAVANGSHTLTARARDAAGNVTTSNSVAVTVQNSSASAMYVKPVASGAANGSSWTDALGANFTPVRGNTYYIADGSYGAKTWSTANSGATVITIKKATVADHGVSTGWNDALGDGEALWGSWLVSTDYWVFDGQWRTSNATNNWDGAASGVDYGFRIVGGGPSGKTLRLDSGSAAADFCTFKFCDFAGGGSGTGDGDDVVYGLQSSNTITFSRCSLRDSDRTIFLMRGEWQNLLVEYSFLGRNNSTTGVHGELLSDVGSDYVTFRNNIIEDTVGTTSGFAIMNGSGAKSTANTANGWKIYGNVFRSTAGGGAMAYGLIFVGNDAFGNVNWMDNCTFANNTIVNLNTAYNFLIYQDKAGTGNVAVNNVFYNNPADEGGDPAMVNAGTLSYNWYYNTDSTGDNGTGKVVSTAGSSSYFQNPSAMNMILAAPLVGTSLAAEFNTDMLGNIRGADGAWDRGAYEFVSGASDVTPPAVSGLNVSNVTTNGVTVTFSTSEPAQGAVQYGTTTGYGSVSTPNATYLTSHSISLTGLSTNTTYHYRVSVTDAAGNNAMTADAQFQTSSGTPVDATAPVVSVTAPSNGAAISGPVSLTATASDNVGVAGVAFLVDGVIVGAEDTASPYGITWDTTTIADGTHSVAARARDAAGNQTTSVAVSVTVGNSVPGGSLKVGDSVVVNISPSLRVRSAPQLAATVAGAQLYLARGIITAGPVNADGFTWWQIDYDAAPDGWSIQGDGSSQWLLKVGPKAPTGLKIVP